MKDSLNTSPHHARLNRPLLILLMMIGMFMGALWWATNVDVFRQSLLGTWQTEEPASAQLTFYPDSTYRWAETREDGTEQVTRGRYALAASAHVTLHPEQTLPDEALAAQPETFQAQLLADLLTLRGARTWSFTRVE